MSRLLFRHWRRPEDGARSSDAGDTLVEIMVAVVIIGISAAGILGGLAAVLGSSGTHRSLTTLDAIVKSFAETAKYQIQQQTGTPEFVPCATPPNGTVPTSPQPKSYVLASTPYPSSGPVGTQVTVFGTGFVAGTTPSVTLNGTSLATFSSTISTAGDLNLTFAVPDLQAGPETIQITDGAGVSATAASPFTVTPLIQLNHASGQAGTPVTATLTGFKLGTGTTVTFGTTPVASPSIDFVGRGTASFNVPAMSGVTTVTASEGTTQASTDFDETGPGSPAGPASTNGPAPVSPLSQYQLGISGVQYWITTKLGTSGYKPLTPTTWTPADQTACMQNTNRADQVQQLTLTANAPGASDQLSFVVANPNFIQPPTTLDVTNSTIPPTAGEATTGNTVKFTANLSPAAAPTPAGIISWSVVGPAMCAPSSTTVPPSPPLTVTCQITNAPAGTYTATATYTPGSGSPYAPTQDTGPPITVYLPTQLAFASAIPTGAASGATWSSAIKVNVEDADGYVASSNTDMVTLAIAPPSDGAQLYCNGSSVSPPQVAAVAGVATFNNCEIVGPASPPNYTLKATDTADGLTPAPASGSITLTPGAAANLTAPTGMPSSAANGATWTNPVTVNIDDTGGNLTSSTDMVTLAIAPPSNGAQLYCNGSSVSPPQVAAVAGVATFNNCEIVGPASPPNYSLTATDIPDGLMAAPDSGSILLTPGAAANLTAPTGMPSSAANGATWTNPVTVNIDDTGGNLTSSTDMVTLAIAPPSNGAQLYCNGSSVSPPQVAAVAGVATFNNCEIVGPAGPTNYTLTATDTPDGLTPAPISSAITLTPGAATKLTAPTGVPSSAANGAMWSSPVTVNVDDSGGNLTNSTDTVTLAIASQPAGNPAILKCNGVNPPQVAAAAGVATFNNCEIVGPTGNYTLTATDTPDGLTPAPNSFMFMIAVGPATQLVFTTPPVGGGPSGSLLATQPVVTIEDSGGNTVTTSTDIVTLAITAGPPSAVLTCSGLPPPPSVAAAGGVATFSSCQMTGPANFYTITASNPSLTSATSPVEITP